MRNSILLLSLILLSSCIKDISDAANIRAAKFDNLNGIYAIPMVNSKITIEDLINNRDEKNYVQDNKNGYLSVIFDTISYSLDIAQFVKIPNVSESENVTVPVIPGFSLIPDGTEVNILNNYAGQKSANLAGIELDKIEIESGSLQLTLSNSSTHAMNYDISFPDFKNSSGQPLNIKQVVSGGVSTVTINLKDFSADLTGGVPGAFNKINYTMTCKITKNGSVQPTDVGFNFNVKDIQYKSITGYFGSTNFSPIDANLKLELFKNNIDGGKLEVENPIIKIYLENDFRVPVRLSLKDDKFNIKYINNTVDNVTGLPFPYTLQAAPNGNAPSKDSIISGNITPNLGTIILKNPVEMNFTLNTQLNPNGPSAQRNVIRRTDKILVKSIFELPLRAKASNFRIDKYIKVDLPDIQSVDSMIDKVEVKLIAESTLPIETIMQIECIDPNNKNIVLKTLLPANALVLKGSQNSVPTTTETIVTLTGDEWRFLVDKGVNELRMINKLSTANGGATFEELKRSQYIHLKIGTKIYLKAKI